MGSIKVLVVDDSLFMRNLIVRLMKEDDSIEVIGTARNGIEGVRMVKELRPDIVTMDVEMPEMNGMEALAHIMDELPTRVIMLSALTKEGAEITVAALQSGAVDFIPKPSISGTADLEEAKKEIISKIKAAARTPLSTLIAARRSLNHIVQRPSSPKTVEGPKEFNQIVAIGTSTGGPKALQTVLTGLPAQYPFPVLIVQHMPPKFTTSLARRLDQICRISVVEAEDNQLLQGGIAYIAPGGYHMTVVMRQGEYRIALQQKPQVNGHRPSVDVLFHSVSDLAALKRHFVLMTGMGSDGAKGMAYAKRHGAASTIAEAEETCVVFGMPRTAIKLNCVDHVLPVTVIAAKIRQLTCPSVGELI
ncbi:chemotaxis response regulator protein-glutamate methylesterase [Paenibacillus sp. N3/727]|uniref:protein-glutamate methylesterase/protein-glutamine glutaminase n=1 Tax=Paenibacillus sp. N3/727 TaxID=2925845 RepID=UPI001F52BC83|nr:chemotaxis response regulator protein-glutamate methylesterase [Paenibacillus sp. N3/727]UNK19677.1 chemotaxis response regulator protein-glutamate methylesterase [Paenibacillus sp. N3/727]